MADYELHADYNRNGRLEATTAEHALRGTAPGVIVVADLDADGRRLPADVQVGSRVMLDRDQPDVLAGNDEAVPLRIVVNAATATAGSHFFLRPVGFPRIRVRLFDGGGRQLPTDTSRPTDIPVAVPTAPGHLDVRLTAKTLPGSPTGHVSDLETRFSLDGAEEESAFRVQLLSVDATGRETTHDEARFTIAPFVILDNASVAVRTYVCDSPGNQPSVIELEAAHRALGVPLVKVPLTVAMGDTWLQDQFQHALMQGPDGWRQVLLHLPRLRSESSNGTAEANLAGFVTSHFPSRNLGVFDDLWTRELQFQDYNGQPRRIPFRQCDRLATVMHLPIRLAEALVDLLKRIDHAYEAEWPRSGDTTTWTDVLGWLPTLVQEFRRRAREAAATASPDWRTTLERLAEDAQNRLNQLATRLPYDADRGIVGLPVASGQVEVSPSEADRIFPRVLQMHHSSNYGGNIEASPPIGDAALGKLVIGNGLVNGERDFMDPDLLRLLYLQRKQPVVQVNTTWLDVGHVDEILSFVPDRRGAGANFGLLCASSGLAMRLLRAAQDCYLGSLSVDHTQNVVQRPSGVLPRLMSNGDHPVTRLFRGKVWEHRHRRPEGDETPQVLEPPRIYQDVSQAMNGGDPADPDSGGINIHGIRYWPGEGPDRVYPADITVSELIYGEESMDGQSTNDFIESQYLAPMGETLGTAFPQVRRFPVPVIFDRVSNIAAWTENPSSFSTSAFTPDVVNLQPINGHLLMPRPYGPRMRLPDVIAVITAATADLRLPSGLVRRIDERFVRTHQLRTGVYWLHRQPAQSRTVSGGYVRSLYDGLVDEADVIAQFRDSFPGASDRDLRRKIIEPNRRQFDASGRLRDGWRRFRIAEDMVDIFEAYIHAVAAELDVPLTWIDSWHYHVHAGGIHCGTNVLRTPARATPLPNVWTVDDLQYTATPMEFEEEEVIVPAG